MDPNKSPLFFSERELTFTFAICYCRSVCRLSVCRLSSVTFVHPTQAIEIFAQDHSIDLSKVLLFTCIAEIRQVLNCLTVCRGWGCYVMLYYVILCYGVPTINPVLTAKSPP